MRSNLLWLSLVAGVVVCFCSADVTAQSGTRGGGLISPPQAATPMLQSPLIQAPVVTAVPQQGSVVAPMTTMQAPIVSATMTSAPITSAPMTTSVMDYSPMAAPSSASCCFSTPAYTATPSYGPARIVDTAGRGIRGVNRRKRSLPRGVLATDGHGSTQICVQASFSFVDFC